jgi:tetratricopeptide (TPR) repeat protein
MHDLLRLYAQLQSDRHTFSDAPERARKRLFQYYLATARDADKHLQAPVKAGLGKFNSQDDALGWFHDERPNLVATVKMADRIGPNQVAIDLPLALGHYFYRRRRFDDWLATLAISRKAADRSPYRNKNKKGESLTQLGWALGEQRQFEEAINACQDAVKIFEKTGNQRGKAGALTSLGHALRGRERFEKAIDAYQAARNIYARTGDRRGSGIVLTNLGLAQARLGHLQEAKISHRAAVAIFQEETGDRLEEGAALTNLGHILRDLGELDQAITACQEAVKAYQEAVKAYQDKDTTDRHGEGNALDQLGLTLQKARRPEKAIIEHEKAIAIFRDTQDRHGEGIALSNVGLAHRKVQQVEDAITACQAAVAIFRENTDPYSEGIALGRLGLALQEAHRFEEAADAHRQNLKICKVNNDWRGQAEVLNNLGIALQRSGRFEEAAGAHRDAAAIFREHDDRPGLALTYSQLAEEQHNPGQALEWAVRCIALFDDVPHPGSGTGPCQLALLTHQLGTATLEACWQQVTGGSLPGAVRDYVCSYRPDSGETPKEAGQ